MRDAHDDHLHTVPTGLELLVHTLTLPELLDGARQRQRSHIGELYRRFGPDLLRRIHVKDSTVTADEILSDVFMKLPDSLGGYTDSGNFEAWLWTIARNALIDKQRKRQRLPDQLPEHVELSAPSRDHTFERSEAMQQLLALLAPQQREAWMLSMDGFSSAEIAERMGTNSNNVSQLLFRAKERLKREAVNRGLTPSDFVDPAT